MGNLLVSPITDKETHRGETTNGDDVYPFAVSSMQGWRVHMEDAHICQPELFAEERLPTRGASSSEVDVTDVAMDGGLIKKAKQEKFRTIELPNHSLFAVFDGHGGSFAAKYAGLNFVRVLSRQPAFVQYAHFVQKQNTRDLMETAATVDKSSINVTYENNSHSNEDDNNNSNLMDNKTVQQAQLHRQGIELLEQAFRDAFLDLDREIWRVVNHLPNEDCTMPRRNSDHANTTATNNNDENNQRNDDEENDHDDEYSFSQEDSGTTAVAVMITPQFIICANAGDSRSVYSKQGHCAIPLSYDHKPDDEGEERRIIDAGGFVRVGRVDGDLAVSRGLGDFRFKEPQLYRSMGTTCVADMPHLNKKHGNRKRGTGAIGGGSDNADVDDTNNLNQNTDILPDDQKVSPIPDIIVQKRDNDLDEFIVIACDGIFDVQTNNECISLTAEIFEEGENDLGLVCEEVGLN